MSTQHPLWGQFPLEHRERLLQVLVGRLLIMLPLLHQRGTAAGRAKRARPRAAQAMALSTARTAGRPSAAPHERSRRGIPPAHSRFQDGNHFIRGLPRLTF
jgi:hypothetical protein